MEVGFKVRFGFVMSREVFVGVFELFSIFDYSLDFFGRKLVNRVLDGDLSFLVRGMVLSRDFEEIVSVNFKGVNKFGLVLGYRRNIRKFEFFKELVVFVLGLFIFVDREYDGSLVVFDSGEDLRFVGGDGSVLGENNIEDVILYGNIKGERGDIEKEEVGGFVGSLIGEDGSLDGSIVSNSFVGVDGFVELMIIEVFGDERLDFGDMGRIINKDNVVNFGGRDFGVFEDFFDGVNSGFESDSVDFFEFGMGDVGREVVILVERVDFDGGLSNGRESLFSMFISRF